MELNDGKCVAGSVRANEHVTTLVEPVVDAGRNGQQSGCLVTALKNRFPEYNYNEGQFVFTTNANACPSKRLKLKAVEHSLIVYSLLNSVEMRCTS
jgi:hypothetical protein